MTKPPKRWLGLPWPVRVDKNSRHASGLHIGEEYIPPTLDYSGKIEHVKLTSEQLTTGIPTRGPSDWDIVPDPSSEGGFRLIESSSGNIDPAQIPQQGSSSSIVYGNGNSYQENKVNNHGGSPNILGTGMTSGAAVNSSMSLVHGSQRPSKNVLGSGMLSASVVGTGVAIGNGYQRPSLSVLGEGVGSGSSSVRGNQPTLHMDWKISPSGSGTQKQLQLSSSSKIGWGVSSANYSWSQFLPAAHWHVASISVGPSQKLPPIGIGVMPPAGHYQSSSFLGSKVETTAPSVSTL